MRNNRIGTDEFLNQRCVVVFDLESILLAQTLKIVLQRICHFRTCSAAKSTNDVSAPALLCGQIGGHRILRSVD
jgi:hypothetical protein